VVVAVVPALQPTLTNKAIDTTRTTATNLKKVL